MGLISEYSDDDFMEKPRVPACGHSPDLAKQQRNPRLANQL